MCHHETASTRGRTPRVGVLHAVCALVVFLALGAVPASAVPVLSLTSFTLIDGGVPPSIGDRDGYAERGESVLIPVTLANIGSPAATTVFGDFVLTVGTSVTLSNTHLVWPNIPAGSSRPSSGGLLLQIAPNAPINTVVNIHATVDESNPTTGPWEFDIGVAVVSASTVRGTVLDQNTGLPIAGAIVLTSGPAIKAVGTAADGTYMIKGLWDGTYVVTVTRAKCGGSVPSSRTLVVPPDVSGVDFLLQTPVRDVRPSSLTMTVGQGGIGEAPLLIANRGTSELQWWLRERPGSGTTALALNAPPVREALAVGDAVDAKAFAEAPNQAPALKPAAFRYSFGLNVYAPRILIYTDDFVHGQPTYIDQALARLGLSYTGYYTWAYAAFENALRNNGPWDLVIVSNEGGPTLGTTLLDALDQYVTSGGKLVFYCYLMGNFETHPLWGHMGVAFRTIIAAPPDPVFWWQPAHVMFNAPRDVPQFTALNSDAFIYGQHVAALPGATAIAGFTVTPFQPDHAAFVLNHAGNALFRGFGDISNDADLDHDGVRDGVELWQNIIDYFIGSVPWMDIQPRWKSVAAARPSDVFVTAETTTMPLGTFRASGLVTTNELLNNATTVPVVLNIVASASSPTAAGRPVPDLTPFTSRTTVVYHFTPATDDEDIQYYRFQVGLQPGDHELMDANIGTSVVATATGSDGQSLYARVRAVNTHYQAGPWSLNSVRTTIDLSPPLPPSTPTDIGLYTSRTITRFNWTAATDPGTTPSGIRSYDMQVGTAPGLGNVFSGNVGNVVTRVVSGAANGQTLYARVRARDRVGNVGPWSSASDGLLVDTALPSAPGKPSRPAVYTSSTAVTFNWTAAGDTGTSASGVAAYEFQVGTRPGLGDVFFGDLGLALAKEVTGADGQTLYARVRARDRAGNRGPWSPVSDPILIDTLAPAAPAAPTCALTATSLTTVAFNWTAAADVGTSASGVAGYDLQVGTWPDSANVFNGHMGGALAGTVTGGSNGRKLYARVRAHDRAGNVGPWSVSSLGVLIDTAAPYAPPGRPTDGGVFTSSTLVRFTWQPATDPGTSPSGVLSYDLGVGSSWAGRDLFVGNVGNRLNSTYRGMNGQTLYAWVRAHDRAGNVGAWGGNSDGITIDTVRPQLKTPKAASRDDWSIYVWFTETVVNADKPSSYMFSRGLRALQVTPVYGDLYIIHTSTQTPLTTYTLTISTAVTDRAGNSMDTAGRSTSFLGQFRTDARSWNLYR